MSFPTAKVLLFSQTNKRKAAFSKKYTKNMRKRCVFAKKILPLHAK